MKHTEFKDEDGINLSSQGSEISHGQSSTGPDAGVSTNGGFFKNFKLKSLGFFKKDRHSMSDQ